LQFIHILTFNNLCSASGNLAIKFASFVLQPYIYLKTLNFSVLQNGLSALTKFSRLIMPCSNGLGIKKQLKKTKNALNVAFRGRIIVNGPAVSPEKLILQQHSTVIHEL
jgi:hypothetical protein